ncbi:MFS transporter [Nocardioides cavernae]|uniref:MFS transporter n=1 Tax=Nocardioides cavernae TaxID=1921566 RepID=A0ABR8N8I1_9ACTN|nr:MFS transporter [Nocardioides cavernae]MBD3923520.1 MFS transporter [Nocardioides cavernae]MBM7511551.1 MFS family permease [Nocardioides cavernae]
MPGYRQLSKNRDFTVLWIGDTVSELGSALSMFAFPLIAYALSGSALTAAMVEAAYLGGLCATLLPAGVLADRVDRKRIMLVSSATGCAAYTSLAVAGATGSLTLPHLVVVALVAGVAAGAFNPAQLSAIRSVVATDDLPTALSQNQARQHVASLLGGPLGGALYAVTRWLPFAVDAITFAVACATVSRVRTDLSAPHRRREPLRRQLGEGFRFIWQRPFFRTLMLWASLSNLVTNAIFFVVLLRMIAEGVPAAQIGLVSMAAGLGGILGAALAPSLIHRMPTGRLTVLIGWMCCLPLVPLTVSSSVWTACACTFFLLLLSPVANAGISSYRMAVTPAHLQGRIGSTSQFTSMSVMPLAPLLGGYLLEHQGGATAITALVVASALLAVLLTSSRSIRSVPRPSEWATHEESAPEPVLAA